MKEETIKKWMVKATNDESGNVMFGMPLNIHEAICEYLDNKKDWTRLDNKYYLQEGSIQTDGVFNPAWVEWVEAKGNPDEPETNAPSRRL